MERLYKLKLSTTGKALAMTSLENKLPSYFSTGSHHKVVCMDKSNFNCVANWSNCGMKPSQVSTHNQMKT
jgi:hypothetical protein